MPGHHEISLVFFNLAVAASGSDAGQAAAHCASARGRGQIGDLYTDKKGCSLREGRTGKFERVAFNGGFVLSNGDAHNHHGRTAVGVAFKFRSLCTDATSFLNTI